jgi:hypothetical protein
MHILDYDTDWICHSTQVTSDQAIKVFDVTGGVLLTLYETDIDWKCNTRLYVDDLLRFIGIRDRVMYDVIMGTEMKKQHEPVSWSTSYTLVRRTCARCTLCEVACSRSGEHSLCSHGNLSHLWRTLRDERNGHLGPLTVEGYLDGSCIQRALPHGPLVAELTAIMSEFNIQMQETWLARR